MRFKLVTISFLIFTSSFSQEKKYDLSDLESIEYDGYIAGFKVPPNDFINQNAKTFLDSKEIQKLKEVGTVSFNVVIDMEEKKILEVYNGGLVELPADLREKVEGTFLKNLEIEPRKYVSTAPDYRYILKSFFMKLDK